MLTANINYVLGAVVWVVAIIALAEVVCAARFVNILAAIALMVLSWWLLVEGGGTMASSLNNLVVGALVIVLSIPPSKVKNVYGSWNKLII